MDILGLPVVVKRILMKKFTIKDRLNLRLTCRAFEQLVAETDAGWFEWGTAAILSGIKWWKDCTNNSVHDNNIKSLPICIMIIDDAKFLIDCENAPEVLLNLRNRLFQRVEFELFNVKPDSRVPPDFTRELIQTFTIQQLFFDLDSENQVERSAELALHFPNIKQVMHVPLHEDAEKLRNIPPMANLRVSHPSIESPPVAIPGEIFLHLVATHQELVIPSDFQFKARYLKRAMKIIATKEIKVSLKEQCRTVAKWLTGYGITEDTEDGLLPDERTEFWKEYEPAGYVLDLNVANSFSDGYDLNVRYEDNWSIRIRGFDWDDETDKCLLYMYGYTAVNAADAAEVSDESETDDSSSSEEEMESDDGSADDEEELNSSDHAEDDDSMEDVNIEENDPEN